MVVSATYRRETALFDVDRSLTSSGSGSRLRAYFRVEIPQAHGVHGLRIQRVLVRGEREAGQRELLPSLTADAGARHLNPGAPPA